MLASDQLFSILGEREDSGGHYKLRKSFFTFFTAALISHSSKGGDSSCHLYEPIERVEKLESYRVGGYHSIAIGDHIHNRYQVVQKLGYDLRFKGRMVRTFAT